MRVGIYTNLTKDADLTVTRQLYELLLSQGISCSVYRSLSQAFVQAQAFDMSSIGDCVDVLLVLGGDGTILSLAIPCAEHGIPIVGINMGNIGFLTEVEPFALNQVLPLLANPIVEERTLLEIVHEGQAYRALNEVVLTRTSAKMISAQLCVDGKLVDRFNCDGFLVCTPTGSTAYSLAGGGPIISPDAPVLGLTPLNSHSLHSRPLVVPDSSTITLQLTGQAPATIQVDGRELLDCDGTLTVVASALRAKFLRMQSDNFYGKLLAKLNKWSTD